jgi:hypothetical protein
VSKILSENEKNAALCKMTLEEYESHMKTHDDFYEKIVTANNDPNHNPYEGWTDEEIQHFENKFYKQPWVGVHVEVGVTTTAEIDKEYEAYERSLNNQTFEELFP